MGCGSSVQAGDGSKPEATSGTTHWASSRAEAQSANAGSVASATKGSPRAGGASPRGGGTTTLVEGNVMLVDAEEESEIEIICEGKGQKGMPASMSPRGCAANGQEGTEAPDGGEFTEVEFSADRKPSKDAVPEPTAEQTALSKRQQEEAAKLAEMRNRFDNQRYQRELVAANNRELAAADGGLGLVSGLGGGSTPPPAAGADAGGAWGTGAGAGAPTKRDSEPLRHELVMGLNFAGLGGPDFAQDCLPGGIAAEPPKLGPAAVSKVRNNHDVFDDDDEMLMEEILDNSVDV